LIPRDSGDLYNPLDRRVNRMLMVVKSTRCHLSTYSQVAGGQRRLGMCLASQEEKRKSTFDGCTPLRQHPPLRPTKHNAAQSDKGDGDSPTRDGHELGAPLPYILDPGCWEMGHLVLQQGDFALTACSSATAPPMSPAQLERE
jgi:hypothetical protein